MTVSPHLNWDIESVHKLSERLGEPTGLLNARLSAHAKLATTPMPTLLQESWRRTNPGAIAPRRFKLWHPDMESAILPEDEVSPACCSWLHLHNCNPMTSVIVTEHHKHAHLFGSLGMAITTGNAGLIERLTDFPADNDSPALGLLNQAYYQGGWFIQIPAYTISDRTIWVRHTVNTPKSALLPINHIAVGTGAEVNIMAETACRTVEPSWLNQRTVVDINPGGRLHLVVINQSNEACRFYDHLEIHLSNDSYCRVTWADMTKGWAVIRRETELTGKGCEANLKGVHVGIGEGQLDLRTTQNHTAPHTTSDLLFKTAMYDQAGAVFQGMVAVSPEAIKTNAYQLNRNLLMSENCHTDSIPKLEILTDDVRCTHGTSAGKLQSEAMFYLMSRGMNEETAMQLLIEGYLGEVSDFLPEGAVKNYWRNLVFDINRSALQRHLTSLQ